MNLSSLVCLYEQQLILQTTYYPLTYLLETRKFPHEIIFLKISGIHPSRDSANTSIITHSDMAQIDFDYSILIHYELELSSCHERAIFQGIL